MGSIKILIVEDELLVADNMAARLRKYGYEITALASSCPEALESARQNPPDIVLLDIMLAGKETGIDTARQLKALGNFILIFLTNIHDDKMGKKARELRPANYLLKPFDERQLHLSIQQALYNASVSSEPRPGQENTELPEELKWNGDVFIREKGTYRKLRIPDIVYITADGNYSAIHTGNSTLIRSVPLIKTLESIRHPDIVQISRSSAVNLNKIEAIKGHILVVKVSSGDIELEISRSHKDGVLKYFHFIK